MKRFTVRSLIDKGGLGEAAAYGLTRFLEDSGLTKVVDTERGDNARGKGRRVLEVDTFAIVKKLSELFDKVAS